jgi:hypothetical protein
LKKFWYFYPQSDISEMRQLSLYISLLLSVTGLFAGNVEKTFYFGDYTVSNAGTYQTVVFSNTRLSGIPGEPSLPYHEIMLMLPPGESAASMEIIGENETDVPGKFKLFPRQYARPVAMDTGHPFIMNRQIYRFNGPYPVHPEGKLITQYLNGCAFALSSFTPVRYNPATGRLSYYKKVTVKITTGPSDASVEALKNLTSSPVVRERVRSFAQNPEMLQQYPLKKAPLTSYQYLIISPTVFRNEFQPLINMYADKGVMVQVITTDSISAMETGYDLQEKIRNYIVSQYQNNSIQYILLAGNPQFVPSRGFYCHVISGGGYDDWNIPSDLYYSGMDGNYDLNGNHIYGEVADSADLLPDVAVARFTVDDTAGLHHLIRKTIAYQTNPVLDELTHFLLAGEFLDDAPVTFGGPFMDLLIDNHSAAGYYTHGIPSSSNSIIKLYDTLISTPLNVWSWSKDTLIALLNKGNGFVHHLGHANTDYMLRMNFSDITNSNFSKVNGVDHNYQILYTQGCYDGAFDMSNCIAVKSVSIDNFLVAGVFNSRYGWFDEGSSPPDGPSEHLEREFVSAVYTDTMPDNHLGEAHRISKVKTAPWVTMPGEWEPGAQRWCHYCCNAFGDPALAIWTAEPTSFTPVTWTGAIDNDWQKAGNWDPAVVPTSLNDIVIPVTAIQPEVISPNQAVCHNLVVQNGAKLKITIGKSLIVRGTVTLN